MTTFSTARITRRALLQTQTSSPLHRSSLKQLSPSSSLLLPDPSASITSTRRTMATFGTSTNPVGNALLFRNSRAWMSTTPPGGDTKSSSSTSTSTEAAKKEESSNEKAPSAPSSSRSTPRRIVVRSQKELNSNDKKNSNNSNNHANNEHNKDNDIQVQVDLPKSVGYIYRRRRASHTGDSRNQHPSAATTTTTGIDGTTHRRRRPPLQQQQQHRQQQNKNLRSTETVYDSCRVPVLIPGRERRPVSPTSAGMMHQHHHHDRHTVSTINASALLHTVEYCKKSAAAATSNSGTEAARRLLRGKKDIVRILRQHVVYPTVPPQDNNESDPKQQQQNVHPHPLYQHHRRQHEPPVPHALQGHGVPTQLLQNHLDLAGQLLELSGTENNSTAVSEVSFQNWSGVLSVDWMRVRSRDGHSSLRPWPVVSQPAENGSGGRTPTTTSSNNDTMASWDQDMALYLSVMNRLATQLSLVLQSQSPTTTTTTATPTSTRKTTDATDEYSNVFSSFSSSQQDQQEEEQIPMHPPPPRYWNVKVWRGMAFAADSLPTEPCPVVEWTPVQGLEAPGHVCIRLQGFPTSSNGMTTTTLDVATSTSNRTQLRRRQTPVTISFTACFRSNKAPSSSSSSSSSSSNGGNKKS